MGYFLEFDLEYRDKLHKLHNKYPVAPEKLYYCKEITDKY